jgi:hypothetical protein
LLLAVVACGGDSAGPSPPVQAVVNSVIVVPDSVDLEVGATTQLVATARDATGAALSGVTISWSSSDPAIATVSGTGLVTAVLAGRATLTASAAGRSATAIVRALPVADTLPGPGTAPAVAAIPLRSFTFDSASYSSGSAELPSARISVSIALLMLEPNATLAQLNTLLNLVHAQIVGGSPGVANQVPGILIIRLPTRSHAEMAASLATMRQQAIVRRVQADIRLGVHTIPAPNTLPSPFTDQWSWEARPNTANWGLEAIRAPQMWNFNDFVGTSQRRTETAVFDAGFFASEDLSYSRQYATSYRSTHGTHVAGIIGATVNNRKGIDGVNPFAALVSAGGFETMSSLVTDFRIFLDSVPKARVVNLSIGYNTGDNNENTTTDAAARQRADADGDYIVSVLTAIAATGRALPVIVVSAGNDSDTFPDQDARYASPYTNAALAKGAAPIIVVEAVANNFASGRQSRATFSNIRGHVSAPGEAILSTVGGPDYQLLNGTSQAAPFVSGLVGYVLALDSTLSAPTLTTNAVRDLLIRTANPVTGAAPMIDAFAAAMDVDRLLNNDKVLRALLDIDDGTLDGNTRVGSGEATDDADGNGGRGDGRIDMSDFRRWRDWFLQLEADPTLQLDGPADHAKRDLNGDGLTSNAQGEAVYPRGDFNGDGKLDQSGTARMSGALDGQQLTDLEVLQSRFVDPHYDKSSLNFLLHSGDITVDAATCFTRPGVGAVLTEILQGDNPGTVVRARVHSAADGPQVFTESVRLAGYRVRVSTLDANLNVVGPPDSTNIDVKLGGDHGYAPSCPRPALNLNGTYAGPYSATVHTNTGQVFPFGTTITFHVVHSGTAVSGTWSTGSGYSGNFTATLSGLQLLNFNLTGSTTFGGQVCNGTWSGAASVSPDGNTITASYNGADCLNTYTDGQSTVTRQGP